MLSSIPNRQHRTVIDALKKLLLYNSDNDKTHLLSLLHQLNIPTDYDNQNSNSSNNSHAYYQVDSQLYRTIQPPFYLTHSYLPPSREENSRNNSRRRKKQKRFKSNERRKKNMNKRSETDHFHYRNMITVRRISWHDMLDSRMTRKYKQDNHKNEKIKNERECISSPRIK
jgi:hypothetical protein